MVAAVVKIRVKIVAKIGQKTAKIIAAIPRKMQKMQIRKILEKIAKTPSVVNAINAQIIRAKIGKIRHGLSVKIPAMMPRSPKLAAMPMALKMLGLKTHAQKIARTPVRSCTPRQPSPRR